MREADVQIYAMGVFEPSLSYGLSRALGGAAGAKLGSAELDGPRLLSEIADQTGGRALAASNLRELPGIAGRIGIELRNQYVLGYYSTNPTRDGKYRRVKLTLTTDRSGDDARLHADYRRGYYAPAR